MARGLISRCLVDAKCWTEQLRSSTSAVFAALAQNPSLIQPMREAYSELHGMIAKDGLPSGVADVVLAAIDGLWLNWVLGLLQVDQSHVDRLRRGLQLLLAPYVPGVAGRSVKARKADKAKSAKTTKAAPSASKLKGRAKR